jgi:hypothetical protein
MRRTLRFAGIGLVLLVVAATGFYLWHVRAEAMKQQQFLCRAAMVQARLVFTYRAVLNRVGASEQEVGDYVRLANESANELCSSDRAVAREKRITKQLNALDTKIFGGFQQTLRGDREVADALVREFVAADRAGSCVAASNATDAFLGSNVLALGNRSTAGSFSSMRGATDGLFGHDFYTLSESQFTKAFDALGTVQLKCESSQGGAGGPPPGGTGALPPEVRHRLSMCFQSVMRRTIDGSRCNPYADDDEEAPAPDPEVTVTQKITNNGDGTETVKEYDENGNLVEEYTRKRTSTYDEVTITHYDNGQTEINAHRDTSPPEGEYRQVTDAYWRGDGHDYQEQLTYSDGTTEVRTHRAFTDAEGNTVPGPYFYRIRPTNKCVAFRGDGGELSSFAMASARQGTPRPGQRAPSMMDGFNSCMCSETGKPMTGYQCPEDLRRWACLTMPFGPDDAPRPECDLLMMDDQPVFRPREICTLIRCNPDETKATFDATRTASSVPGGPGRFTYIGCGCFPKSPSVTPAGQCSTVMCSEGATCQCHPRIGCGCLLTGGGGIPGGGLPGGGPRPGWGLPQ